MSSDTLVLNMAYHAVHIADWQKAISLLYQGHAEAVDENLQAYNFADWVELSSMMKENAKGFVNSSTMKVAIPEVIRLTRYDRLPKQDVKFTRQNIYEHYGFKCCYCGGKFKTSELNLDHVMPKSRGGKTTWDNIVLSCITCNTVKDDRTPDEATYPIDPNKLPTHLKHKAGHKMTLLVKPSRPKWKGVRTVMMKAPMPIPVSWQRLIDKAYWEAELEKDA